MSTTELKTGIVVSSVDNMMVRKNFLQNLKKEKGYAFLLCYPELLEKLMAFLIERSEIPASQTQTAKSIEALYLSLSDFKEKGILQPAIVELSNHKDKAIYLIEQLMKIREKIFDVSEIYQNIMSNPAVISAMEASEVLHRELSDEIKIKAMILCFLERQEATLKGMFEETKEKDGEMSFIREYFKRLITTQLISHYLENKEPHNRFLKYVDQLETDRAKERALSIQLEIDTLLSQNFLNKIEKEVLEQLKIQLDPSRVTTHDLLTHVHLDGYAWNVLVEMRYRLRASNRESVQNHSSQFWSHANKNKITVVSGKSVLSEFIHEVMLANDGRVSKMQSIYQLKWYIESINEMQKNSSATAQTARYSVLVIDDLLSLFEQFESKMRTERSSDKISLEHLTMLHKSLQQRHQDFRTVKYNQKDGIIVLLDQFRVQLAERIDAENVREIKSLKLA